MHIQFDNVDYNISMIASYCAWENIYWASDVDELNTAGGYKQNTAVIINYVIYLSENERERQRGETSEDN